MFYVVIFLFLSFCVHTFLTVCQETSSFPSLCVFYLYFFAVLPAATAAAAAAFVPLFITTISLHLAVYLFSFNEPQFAADLEERWARLKPRLGVFEELLIVLHIQYT